jgi:hypothetical protein
MHIIVYVFTELIQRNYRKIVNLTLRKSINKVHQKCISQNTKLKHDFKTKQVIVYLNLS